MEEWVWRENERRRADLDIGKTHYAPEIFENGDPRFGCGVEARHALPGEVNYQIMTIHASMRMHRAESQNKLGRSSNKMEERKGKQVEVRSGVGHAQDSGRCCRKIKCIQKSVFTDWDEIGSGRELSQSAASEKQGGASTVGKGENSKGDINEEIARGE
jgi:hypothetical protein